MKVYVAVWFEYNESSVLGVYRSVEAAKAAQGGGQWHDLGDEYLNEARDVRITAYELDGDAAAGSTQTHTARSQR